MRTGRTRVCSGDKCRQRELCSIDSLAQFLSDDDTAVLLLLLDTIKVTIIIAPCTFVSSPFPFPFVVVSQPPPSSIDRPRQENDGGRRRRNAHQSERPIIGGPAALASGENNCPANAASD